jgi:predicted ATP-dependent serine protease
MSKKTIYQCSDCGETYTLYKDQCPNCKANFSLEKLTSTFSVDETEEIFDLGYQEFYFEE